MGSDARTGEMPAIPEDTIDLGDRLDPLRTLLRRTATGDQRAATALVDVLGPRIHGLAVHITGSSARAEKLTVAVLRSCLRDAGELATSGLPGEAAVLDRARRAAVATHPTGDVRSLAGPGPAADRTSDRREVGVLRVLLELPPAQRALVESAAQGRFPYLGIERRQPALILSEVLDTLVPFGGPPDAETRGLSALDALALADAGERLRLRELTQTTETAGVHRRAIEAAAQLALLTAVPPSRDLRVAVLEGFHPPAPARAVDPGPEPTYSGTYATPVLGTDTQRRLVGPPPLAGGLRGSTTDPSAVPAPTPGSAAAAPHGAHGGSGAPAFAFRATDEKQRTRRGRRREKRRDRATRRGVPWFSRTLAAAALIAALVLGALLLDGHRRLEAAEDFSETWIQHSLAPEAQLVRGVSDHGTWQAVIAPDGIALRAEGVTGWDGEVLELWAETGGEPRSLGVLESDRDGSLEFTAAETADRLFVTREMTPRSESGSPSSRVVANLDPRA